MKIAILKKDYSENGGGAERYARQVCRALAKRKHDVFVYSQTFSESCPDGINHVKVSKNNFAGCSATAAFHNSVQKVLRRCDYDIVYALSRTYPSDFYRVTESLHCEWMKIRYPRYQLYNPRHMGILNLERKIFNPQNSGIIICNSELTRRQVILNFSFPEERIKVVRNGVDHQEFMPANEFEKGEIRKRLELPEDKFIVFFAASDFRIKGLANALKAVSMLPAPIKSKTLLLIAGGGSVCEYRRLADSLKVSGNLFFAGRIAKVRDYYVSSDILIHPTLYEPFANVCLEALACGLPVLTTRTNGASELIKEGENGFTVTSASDEDEMAGLLAKFAELSSDARAKFSIRALESVAHLNWDLHIDNLLQLFSLK